MNAVKSLPFGMKTGCAILAVLLAACSSPQAKAFPGPPDVNEPWYMTFESEFELPDEMSDDAPFLLEGYDRLSPDSDNAKWEYRYGPRRDAYSVEDNVFVTELEDQSSTALVLRTSKDTVQSDEFSNPMRTGFIRTRNYENTGPNDEMLFSQRYGYFEARMSLSSAPGQWGAFWLMPFHATWCADSSGRDGTEIDIVEGYPIKPRKNYKRNKSIHFAIHYDGYRAFHKKIIQPFPDGDQKRKFRHFDTSNFHTYGLLWTPDKYVWYVDGHPVFTIDDPDHISQVPKFLKLSTEVAPWSGKLDPKLLPADTIVDWVRVWQTDTLAAGNPYIFEAEDAGRVNRSEAVYTKKMTAGTWCRGVFAKAKVNETGSVNIPIDAPVRVQEIGVRVSNPHDRSSSLSIYVDGELKETWPAIDLDPIFILKHKLDAEISDQIEIVWDGKLAVDQVYLIPEQPTYR